jgi:hypothetical protein
MNDFSAGGAFGPKPFGHFAGLVTYGFKNGFSKDRHKPEQSAPEEDSVTEASGKRKAKPQQILAGH